MDRTDTDWQAFYDRHGPALLLYARQVTGSLAQAEDAMHDGFVRFWKREAGVDDPLAYLYRCVRHAALDLQRGDGRRQSREQAQARPDRSDAPDPWQDAARDETEQKLRDAVAALDPPQREVLTLKVWGGLTFDQIAQALELPRSTAAARHGAAIKALQGVLSAEEML